MGFPDPSNSVMEAYKYAGGGWGAVFVTVGLVIGAVVGLAQPTKPRLLCVQWEPGSIPADCVRSIEYLDPMAWLGNGAAGVAVGCFVGLIVWLGLKEYHKESQHG
jgi:hypothetical protein